MQQIFKGHIFRGCHKFCNFIFKDYWCDFMNNYISRNVFQELNFHGVPHYLWKQQNVCPLKYSTIELIQECFVNINNVY